MATHDTRMLLLGAVALFEPVNGYQIRREPAVLAGRGLGARQPRLDLQRPVHVGPAGPRDPHRPGGRWAPGRGLRA
ncbi:hypothetical protein [Nocardioides convexus]|uniref:hypothetical protein n=1 Tax=Nocardioides convexus TaxID=2712224 RepID=UPI00241842B7|nr:hypothetical protein [Nocardioides convexus]